MLVLSRKSGQRIICTLPDGRTMAITVCAVRGKYVRLGFEAPQDVNIVREELCGRPVVAVEPFWLGLPVGEWLD